MKALTICQPYAHLIMLPTSDPRHKRVENRKWFTSYRGPLLIHAGKSKSWLSLDDVTLLDDYGIHFSEFVFGALLGVCNVVDCFVVKEWDEDGPIFERPLPPNLAWVADHEHTNGPNCLILDDVRKFLEPIPCPGKQMFFEVPDELVAEQLQKAVPV